MTCSHDHNHTHDHDSLAHHGGHDAVCLDHVSYRYPSPSRKARNGDGNGSGNLVLRDVTLHIEQGTKLGIIGPNGAGKTTLVKIILGLIRGYTGKVRVMDLSPTEACRRGNVVGYVPQRLDVEWRFPVTAEQAVLMGLTARSRWLPWFSKGDHDYARHVMEKVGVVDLRDRPVGQLSGGQQQRLFIARALVAQPKVLILDEPLVGVDEAGQQRFAALINELHASLGLTIVIVSHDIQAIAAGCNRVACLRQSIHFHDAPQGLTREVLAEVFAHEVAPVVSEMNVLHLI